MLEFDYAALRRIGLNQSLLGGHTLPDDLQPGAMLMRLAQLQRDRIVAHDGHQEHEARLQPALQRRLQDHRHGLAVGDWLALYRETDGSLWAFDRLDPASHIARRANDGRRQALAANVDTALLVMGLDLDFNLRRLERYVAMVRACAIAPVIVLTKADIGTDVEGRIAAVQQRLPASIPCLAVNALAPEAAQALKPWLDAGQTLVLLGASGTGKSTLTNTLCHAGQATGGARSSDGRGKHTTTARSLHLCDGGACIIDTPGLRAWQPDADADTLAATFDDIEELAAHCLFRDCGHSGEPGCAVREHIDADRLLNYQKLLRDAARAQQTPLERIAERSKWKMLGKAGTQRARDKRRM